MYTTSAEEDAPKPSFLDNFNKEEAQPIENSGAESDGEDGVEFESWNLQGKIEGEVGGFTQEVHNKFRPVGAERYLAPKKKSDKPPTPMKEVEMVRDEFDRAYARGIRKSSEAWVYVKKGCGEHYVNGVPYTEYFDSFMSRLCFVKPFEAIDKLGEFNVWVDVKGGGSTGQSGAIQLGIARALQMYNPEFRRPLKKGGFLTVDRRKVERKKFGRKKARKMKQWVKR